MIYISHCTVSSDALSHKEPVSREIISSRVKTQGRAGRLRDLYSYFHDKATKTNVAFIYCRTAVLFYLMAPLLFFSITVECAYEYENDHCTITKAAIQAAEYTKNFEQDKRFDRMLQNAGLPDHVFVSNNNFHRALKSAGMTTVPVAAEGSVLSVFYMDTTGHYITKIRTLISENYWLKKSYSGDWPMQYDVYRKCPGETEDSLLSEANQVASFCFFWHLNEEILIPVIENLAASFIKVKDESGRCGDVCGLDTFSVFGFMVLDNYYLQILFLQGVELLDSLKKSSAVIFSSGTNLLLESIRGEVGCFIGKHNFLSDRVSKVYQRYKQKYSTNKCSSQSWSLENKRVDLMLQNMGHYIKAQGNILSNLAVCCGLDTLPMDESPDHEPVTRSNIAATAGENGKNRMVAGNEKTPEKESASAASEKMQGEYPDTLPFSMESACARGDDGDGLKQDIGADKVEDITKQLGNLCVAEETRAQQKKQDEAMDEEDEAREESRKKAARPSDLVPMTVTKTEKAMSGAGDAKGEPNASVAVDLAGSYTELFINPEKKEQRILLNKKQGLHGSGKPCRAITGSLAASKVPGNRTSLNNRDQRKNKSKKKSNRFAKNEKKQSPPYYTLSLNSLCDDGLSGKDNQSKIKKLVNSMAMASVADENVIGSQPAFSFDASARVKEINDKKEKRNKKRHQAVTGSAVFMSGLYKILSKRKFWYVVIPVIAAIGIATDIPDLGLEFLYNACLASLALFYDSDEELMSPIASHCLLFSLKMLATLPLYNMGFLFTSRNQLSRESKKRLYKTILGQFSLVLLISPFAIIGKEHLNIRQRRALVPGELFVYSNDSHWCSNAVNSTFCYYDREFIRYKSDYPRSKVDEWYSEMVSIGEEVKGIVDKSLWTNEEKDSVMDIVQEVSDIVGVCGLVEDDKLDRLCVCSAFYMDNRLYLIQKTNFYLASQVEKYKKQKEQACFMEKGKKRGNCFLLKVKKAKSIPISHSYIDSIPCIVTEDGVEKCFEKQITGFSKGKDVGLKVPLEVKGDFWMLCYNGFSKGWTVVAEYVAEKLTPYEKMRMGRTIVIQAPVEGEVLSCVAVSKVDDVRSGIVFYIYDGEKLSEFLLNY